MSTPPLAIPEVILRIGLYIQIWFPATSDKNITTYKFQPQDLLAAIKLNRLFHTTLEPLLWTISQFVNLGWAVQLIKANPNINLLDWNYPDEDEYQVNGCNPEPLELGFAKDLQYISGLQKLRSLTLRAWTIDILYLFHVLDKMADSLEELCLAKDCKIVQNPAVDTATTTLVRRHFATMTEKQVAEAVKAALLSKLTTLHLGIYWGGSYTDYVYDLVRACPVLETLALDPSLDLKLKTWKPILREFCPQLRAVHYIPHHWPQEKRRWYFSNNEGVIALIESIAPGNLMDLRIQLQVLDNRVTTAILKHGVRLETLEMLFPGYGGELFGNVAKITQRCKRLKRLSLRSARDDWSARDAEALLTKLGEPWICQELESLELRGFMPDILDYIADATPGKYDTGEPSDDPASYFELKWRLPQHWRCIPRSMELSNDSSPSNLVHPHLRIMVFAAIISRVGKYIPVWFPRQTRDRSSEFDFKPKHLLSAMKVNRTFYAALSPYLWTVYNESALEPRLYKDSHTSNNFPAVTLPSTGLGCLTLSKNCRHIRYLGLVQDKLPSFMYQQPTMFDFKDCTNLRELRLSMFVDPQWAGQLIRANPNLRVLEWSYPDLIVFNQYRSSTHSSNPRGSDDLEYLSSLSKLRSLKLQGWVLLPLHLCQVLNFNADTLEELNIASESRVIQLLEQPTDAIWLVPKHSEAPSSTTGTEDELQVEKNVPLSLPKLKSLHLNLDWSRSTGESIYGLVKSMPALEELNITLDQHMDLHKLGRNLKASCPNLHSIRTNGQEFKNETPVDRLKIVALSGACAPEHLVNFKIGLSMLDLFTTGSLLWHKDSLSNLDLTLYGRGDQGETINGLRNLLGQCRGLKRVTVIWEGQNLDRAHGSSLLSIPWACSGLEGLTLRGMEIQPIEVNNISIGNPVAEMIKAKFANLGPDFVYTQKLLNYFGWLYIPGYYSSEDWPADPVFRLLLVSMLALRSPLPILKVIQLNGETYLKPSLTFQQ
ncbi:hypothetical protein BGW39_006194 [Mortierella sp. 14UC]|nr:hypothetical protein BGW39_006194 [Mortierella sp. 14UC]